MKFASLRREVQATALKMVAAGLTRLSAGNVSALDEAGHVAITPAGLPYERMQPEDVVIVDLEGRPVEGRLKPSSETPLHTALMRAMPQVRAVVHAHSIYAMTCAALGRDIPVVCVELFLVGGPVPVAPYACPGTPRNGQVAVESFQARPGLRALLLRNHGLVAIGADLEQAYQHAVNLETGAQVYYQAALLGEPIELTPEQIAEIVRVYG